MWQSAAPIQPSERPANARKVKLMRIARFICSLLLVVGLLTISAQSPAQVAVGISIRVGPPVLPVYEQPICPEPGYIWSPVACGHLRHAAWIVSTAFSRDGGIRTRMRSLLTPRPIVWHLVALCMFPALLLVGAIVTRVQGGALPQPRVAGTGLSYALLVIVEFGYSFFVGGGVSEEPGWRGFLLPRLQDRFSPLVASLLVWFPWALWHAPLDFAGYAGSTLAAYLRTRVFILIPLCIIITWVYNRCGKTILSAALFHSAFNAAPDFIPSTVWAVWMVSIVALMVIVTDRMWQKNRREES